MKHISYKVLLLIFASLYCITESYAQHAELLGTVVDSYDSNAVPQVNISLVGTNKGTTTDQSGHFNMILQVGDTLVFSDVQYRSQMYLVTETSFNTEVLIYLEPELYELDQVTINSFSKDRFKQDFINLELPPDPYAINLNIPSDISYVPLEEKIEAPPSPGYIPGGAGFIFYPNWDFRAKQLQWQREQVVLWQEKEALQQQIAAKYNRNVVRKYTDLSEEQLDEFMKFCDLQPGFILYATEYELAEVLKTCYITYMEQQ